MRVEIPILNDQNLEHDCLRVDLLDDGANRFGLGAEIALVTEGVEQVRRVESTRSYLSQTEDVVTFGLGSAARVERLRVVWPDDQVREVADRAADQFSTVRRPGLRARS